MGNIIPSMYNSLYASFESFIIFPPSCSLCKKSIATDSVSCHNCKKDFHMDCYDKFIIHSNETNLVKKHTQCPTSYCNEIGSIYYNK
jgi:hypothetical protein